MTEAMHKYYRDKILSAALNAARLKAHRSYINEQGALVRVGGDSETMTRYFMDEAIYAAETYLIALGVPEDLDPLKTQDKSGISST